MPHTKLKITKNSKDLNIAKCGLPWNTVVRTLCFHCRGHRFDSWLGNSHVMWHGQKQNIAKCKHESFKVKQELCFLKNSLGIVKSF